MTTPQFPYSIESSRYDHFGDVDVVVEVSASDFDVVRFISHGRIDAQDLCQAVEGRLGREAVELMVYFLFPISPG